jgi:hypothetical protein
MVGEDRFGLSPKVAKLVRLTGAGTPNEHEVAKVKLLRLGYFLDRVDILWDADKVPEFAKDTEL